MPEMYFDLMYLIMVVFFLLGATLVPKLKYWFKTIPQYFVRPKYLKFKGLLLSDGKKSKIKS